MSNQKTGVAILSVMGFVWCTAGAILLPPPWRAAATVGASIICGALLYANASGPAVLARLDRRIFALAAAFEIVGIFIAIRFLVISHQATFIPAAIAAIVGLHFVGMWLASDNRTYLGIAAAMCGAGLASVFLSPPARMQVAALASGITLWAGAARGIWKRSAAASENGTR